MDFSLNCKLELIVASTISCSCSVCKTQRFMVEWPNCKQPRCIYGVVLHRIRIDWRLGRKVDLDELTYLRRITENAYKQQVAL